MPSCAEKNSRLYFVIRKVGGFPRALIKKWCEICCKKKKKEIIKFAQVFLGLNVEWKPQFCNNTDKAYKVKRLNFDLIIVLLYLFCPGIIKLCAYFLLDFGLYYL